MRAPRATPTTTATIHVYGRSRPRSKVSGIHFVWTIAIVYPRKPSSDPTDRSMLRDTMMSTIPVAMIAIDELWTDRFQRFRAVRKSPPERMWNAIQMTASDSTMPTRPRVDLGRLHRSTATSVAGFALWVRPLGLPVLQPLLRQPSSRLLVRHVRVCSLNGRAPVRLARTGARLTGVVMAVRGRQRPNRLPRPGRAWPRRSNRRRAPR